MKHSSESRNTVPSDDTLWTARDAAAFLRCSGSYVYKASERGALPCVRIGRMLRFRPTDVRALAANCPE